MFCNNLEDLKICRGCLCTTRTLAPIDKYYDLLKKNLGPNLKRGYRLENKNLLICWECRMALKNFEKLLFKVKKAQDFFISNRKRMKEIIEENENINLSTLSAKRIFDFNYCYTFEPDIIKLEKTESDSKTFENDFRNIEIHVECKEEVEKFENDQDIVSNETNCELSQYNRDIDSFSDCDNVIAENIDNDNNINLTVNENLETTIIKEKNDDLKISESEQTLKVSQRDNTKTKKKKIRQPKSEPQKFKVTLLTIDNLNADKTKYYNRLPMDNDEIEFNLKEEESKNYTKMKFKCGKCLSGFKEESQFWQHKKEYHSAKMRFECDMCGIRTHRKTEMAAHCREHYTKLICLLCNYSCCRMWQLDEHLLSVHHKIIECQICGAKFSKTLDYAKHHKNFHKQFVCEHCGKRFSKKYIIENHMQRRHAQYKCTICGIQFKTYVSHRWHMKIQHVKNPSEETFCVECNIQFDNVIKYKNHFQVFVKHRPPVKKSFPCPECGKVYNKHITMKYHYNYEHLKRTQFICTKCDRYFLNGFRLRLHTATVHDKISRPKNKMCTLCGRGFSTNRILENHIRTHTGERPFLCAQCPAAFAQKTALVTHTRAIHKEERAN
ncbi:PR domain zinc finger protein 5-like [Galleria mellonella]|uniref:PR domain zinc finger protein 5-like n=1 Tax=Galleria mellonella TaxID=7137 RepID=A0ABM3M9Y3_GALME|nr:PR domain zinc finger protein 5-like [Galleria mellonella]